MYKLIAIDMDGTLLNSKKEISKGNETAVKTAKLKGTNVVIATGRPQVGIKRYSDQLSCENCNDYQIVFNGALVINNKTNEVIYEELLNGKDVEYLYRISKDLKINIHAFNRNQECITPKMSKYTELEGSINNINVGIVDFNTIEENEKIIKIMFIDEPEILQTAIDNLPDEVYKKYSVVRSAPYFLEFLNKKAEKWKAVEALANHLNITNEETICIGDAGNDYEMVKNAGLGVAMANGFKEVLDVAKFITKDNNSDGVAYAINKYVNN